MIQESPLEIGSEQLFDLIEAPFTYAWQTSDSIQFARRLSKHKNWLACHLPAKRSRDETCILWQIRTIFQQSSFKLVKKTCWQPKTLASPLLSTATEFLILAVSMKGMPLLSVHAIAIWWQGMGEAPVQQTKWGLVRFLSCCDFACRFSKPSIYKLINASGIPTHHHSRSYHVLRSKTKKKTGWLIGFPLNQRWNSHPPPTHNPNNTGPLFYCSILLPLGLIHPETLLNQMIEQKSKMSWIWVNDIIVHQSPNLFLKISFKNIRMFIWEWRIFYQVPFERKFWIWVELRQIPQTKGSWRFQSKVPACNCCNRYLRKSSPPVKRRFVWIT